LIFQYTIGTAAADQLTVSGHARVIDGDTIAIGSTHVRLKGVDAAERGTVIGEEARRAMMAIVGYDNTTGDLTCVLIGEKTWRREVGYCFRPDRTDINRAIIAQGAALACPALCAIAHWGGASSTPRLLGSSTAVSGILDRPIKSGDDTRE
jgi:endonuclease YncB( thermonuclease family)